jgi:hypothetical protein
VLRLTLLFLTGFEYQYRYGLTLHVFRGSFESCNQGQRSSCAEVQDACNFIPVPDICPLRCGDYHSFDWYAFQSAIHIYKVRYVCSVTSYDGRPLCQSLCLLAVNNKASRYSLLDNVLIELIFNQLGMQIMKIILKIL